MPFVIDPPSSPPLAPPPDDGGLLWELFYESLGFHVEDDLSGDLRRYIEGLCAPLQDTFDLVRPRPGMAGWAILLDPDLCPAWALPFPAMLVGVEITPEMSEEQIRNEIRQPTGWKRGQTESIRIGTRRTLRPVVEGEELFVIVRPRTPEPGRHFIRTLTAQTPEPDRTEWLLEHKLTPAWERVDYAAISGQAFADLTGSKYTTFGPLREALDDFRDLTEALPGEI